MCFYYLGGIPVASTFPSFHRASSQMNSSIKAKYTVPTLSMRAIRGCVDWPSAYHFGPSSFGIALPRAHPNQRLTLLARTTCEAYPTLRRHHWQDGLSRSPPLHWQCKHAFLISNGLGRLCPDTVWCAGTHTFSTGLQCPRAKQMTTCDFQ